jgi:cohesin loading factor subunit SCC2
LIITDVCSHPDQEAEAEYGEGEEEKVLDKLDPEERRTRFLQRVLLDYLTVTGGEEDANAMASRHFYISQW